MLAKVVLLIACSATVSSSMLALRQQRIQAASDMARALARSDDHDRTLWTVRGQIASATAPDQVLVMAAALGPTRSIPRELCAPETATASTAPKQPPTRILRTAAQERPRGR